MKPLVYTLNQWVKCLLVLILLSALGGHSQAQTIRYVRPDGGRTLKDGLTWATAYDPTQLQRAIDDLANLTVANRQVWVAGGTYKPTTSTTDRNASFHMATDVAIYGGFSPFETPIFSQRNPATNPTILSGDIDGDGTRSGNSYHVINNGYVENSALLDGFIITGGNIEQGESLSSTGGGGIGTYAFHNSPTLINCIFRDNNARGGGAGSFFGGTPTFINCVFSNNTAITGPALDGNRTALKLINCTLVDNKSDYSQTIWVYESTVQLTNCISFGNNSDAFGGVGNVSFRTDYCLLEAGKGTADQGSNNVTTTVSPFVSASSYRLKACSFAINAGDPTATNASSGSVDLAGNPRVYPGGRIDIGAYEYQGSGSAVAFTSQPPSASSVAKGTTVQIPIGLSTSDLILQWYKDGAVVTNQTSATLTLPNAQPQDGGTYALVATSSCNSVTTSAFSLSVVAYPIRYVKAGGAGDGTSWATASGDLQRQINAPYVEQVWVAQGTYTPGIDRTASFRLRNNVVIYGGFPPSGSPTLTDRHPASYSTILSGEIGNPGDLTDNTYQVIRNQDLDNTATLDGVIITGGYANGSSGTDNLGGGMYNSNSSPRLLNCILRLNTALGNGGGMYNTNSSPTLINCSVYANQAINNGGGIYNVSFSSPQLINCLLWGNTASLGKAIDNRNFSRPSLTNCIVWNNDGQSAFLNEDGSSSLTASSCLIEPEATNYSGSNNQTTDPRFVDAAGGNFRLMAGSPAINSGSTSAYTDVPGGMPPSPAADLGGTGRIQGGTIDMGPYEFSLPPDLIPILYVTPSLAYSTTTGSVVVDVFEINSAPTSGIIRVYIAKSSLLSLRFDPGATSLAGKPVQNSLWSFDDTSNSDAYILTTTQVIGASGKRSIGLSSTLTPGQTRGRVSLTATLVGGSGGEVTLTNNTDADQVEYFNK